MVGFRRMLRVFAPLAVVCGALFIANCGGNNNSSPSAPTTYPTSAAYTVGLSAASGTIALPIVSRGNSATLSYIGSGATPFPSPFPSAGITFSATASVAAPTNAPAPTSAKRQVLAKGAVTGALYVSFQLTTALPASIFSTEVLTLGSTMPTNVPYFVELDDLTTKAYINTYPGSAVTNGAVTFANSNGYVPNVSLANVTLAPTDTYLLQFYYLGAGASPSPSPSPNGSASPIATPVAVSTTVPLGAPQTFGLPVTAGGFVAGGTVPAASGPALTITGTSQLPTGISGVGTTNSAYPFYALGFSSTAAVTLPSPQITLQLPTNFSSTNPILAALCTTAACPVDARDVAVPPTVATGTASFAQGAFAGFTSVGTQPLYVIFYTSRTTPIGNIASPVPVAAGGVGVINVPTITTNTGTSTGDAYSSTVTIGGLSAATTVTIAAQTGLFAGISAIVPNTQTVVYALAVTANPGVSTSGFGCGSTGCSTVVLSLPADVVAAAAAASKKFYVEECSAAACPVKSSDVVQFSPNTANQLSVDPTKFGSDITGFDPVNPVYLVFLYK